MERLMLRKWRVLRRSYSCSRFLEWGECTNSLPPVVAHTRAGFVPSTEWGVHFATVARPCRIAWLRLYVNTGLSILLS